MNKQQTKKQRERMQALMPDNKPRYVRVYDNEGRTVDRYTCVYTGNYRKRDDDFQYVGMSDNPFHPQGFGQHGSSRDQIDLSKHGWPPAVGRKNELGTRITFDDLPEQCKILVLRDYMEIWDLGEQDNG